MSNPDGPAIVKLILCVTVAMSIIACTPDADRRAAERLVRDRLTAHAAYTPVELYDVTRGLRLLHPPTWTRLEPAPTSPTALAITSSLARGGPAVLLSVDSLELPREASAGADDAAALERFKETALAAIDKQFRHSRLRSLRRYTLAGRPAYRMVFAGESDGVRGIQMNVFTVRGPRVYTAAYMAANEWVFNAHLAEAERIVDSIEIDALR